MEIPYDAGAMSSAAVGLDFARAENCHSFNQSYFGKAKKAKLNTRLRGKRNIRRDNEKLPIHFHAHDQLHVEFANSLLETTAFMFSRDYGSKLHTSQSDALAYINTSKLVLRTKTTPPSPSTLL